MRRTTRLTMRLIVPLLLVCIYAPAPSQATARTVTDSAGRVVELPERIPRVLAAGPPGSILLHTLAPEKMVGWVRTPTAAEKEFLLPSVRDRPEYGRLTGRGNTANMENVLKFQPDLILDIGSVGPTYVSLANNVQDQTKIPYILLDGSFAKTPEMYRLLGDILGVQERAEQLARYADETLNGLTFPCRCHSGFEPAARLLWARHQWVGDGARRLHQHGGAGKGWRRQCRRSSRD